MIRREIATTAAVAAAFLTAGLLCTPERSEAPAPTVSSVKTPAAPAPTFDVEPVVEPHPAELPMLDWPAKQPDDPLLMWPPSGCDAGIWSVQHSVEPMDETTTRVSWTERDEVESFDVEHPPGTSVRYYPTAPQLGWAVVTDSGKAEVELRRINDGETACSARRGVDSAAMQARALATGKKLIVYTLTDHDWTVDLYDESCVHLGGRLVPSLLLHPSPLTEPPWVEIPRGVGPEFTFTPLGDAVEIESWVDQSTRLQARERIEHFAHTVADGLLLAAYWDSGATYLRALDRNSLELQWSAQLDRELRIPPVTHAAAVQPFVAMRGTFDAAASSSLPEELRVFDIRTGELIGRVNAFDLPSIEPLVWRWPTTDPAVACMGTVGRYGECEGQSLVLQTELNSDQIIAHVSRNGDSPPWCGAALEAPGVREVRSHIDERYALQVFAVSDDTLYGWQINLDCDVQKRIELPRSDTVPWTDERDRLRAWDISTGHPVIIADELP